MTFETVKRCLLGPHFVGRPNMQIEPNIMKKTFVIRILNGNLLMARCCKDTWLHSTRRAAHVATNNPIIMHGTGELFLLK